MARRARGGRCRCEGERRALRAGTRWCSSTPTAPTTTTASRSSSPRFNYYFVLVDGESRAVLDRDGTTRRPAGRARAVSVRRRRAGVLPDARLGEGRRHLPDLPRALRQRRPGQRPRLLRVVLRGRRRAARRPARRTASTSTWSTTGTTSPGLSESPYRTDGKPDWNSFYGGDIEGVRAEARLPRRPRRHHHLLQSRSSRRRATTSTTPRPTMKLDPHFGTNEEFAAFVDECHEHGHPRRHRPGLQPHRPHALGVRRRQGEGRGVGVLGLVRVEEVAASPAGPCSAPANAADYYDCWWGFGQMPNLNFDLSRAERRTSSRSRTSPTPSPTGRSSTTCSTSAEYWLTDDGHRRLPARRARRGAVLVLGALPREGQGRPSPTPTSSASSGARRPSGSTAATSTPR